VRLGWGGALSPTLFAGSTPRGEDAAGGVLPPPRFGEGAGGRGWGGAGGHPRPRQNGREVWDVPQIPLYVKLEASPLDKGPKPEIHWLKIVERGGERLFSPHGTTDFESSPFLDLASEQDWSSESHALSDTV
jgi:hypothetical protein